MSNATTAVSNSNDKNTTLCDCGWNVWHSTHGTSPQDEVGKLRYSSMNPACFGPLTHAVSICLAMYSLLNMIKSLVASQNIFPGVLATKMEL